MAGADWVSTPEKSTESIKLYHLFSNTLDWFSAGMMSVHIGKNQTQRASLRWLIRPKCKQREHQAKRFTIDLVPLFYRAGEMESSQRESVISYLCISLSPSPSSRRDDWACSRSCSPRTRRTRYSSGCSRAFGWWSSDRSLRADRWDQCHFNVSHQNAKLSELHMATWLHWTFACGIILLHVVL